MRATRPTFAACAAAAVATAACGGSPATRSLPAWRPSSPAEWAPTMLRLPLHPLQLPNGLAAIIVPENETDLVHVSVRYAVGAAEDPPGRPGLAHLVEHMMFEQTRDGASLFDRLSAVALWFNAETTADSTQYDTVADAGKFAQLLTLEAERMRTTCADIDDARFEREKDVVISELRRRSGPYATLMEQLLADIYGPSHPYGHPPGGDEASIRTASRADVCSFIDRYYRPDRALVVVTGNVHPRAAAAVIRSAFGNIVQPPAPLRANVHAPGFDGRSTRYRLPVKRPFAVIVRPATIITDEVASHDDIAERVLDQELYRLVGDDDSIVDAQVLRFGGERAPLQAVVIEVDDPNALEPAVDRFFALVRRIARDDGERWLAIRLLTDSLTDFVSSIEDVYARARVLGEYCHYGAAGSAYDALRRRAHVPPDRVLDRLRGFERASTRIFYVVPTSDADAAAPSIQQSRARYDAAPWLPAVDRTDLERDIPVPAQRWKPTIRSFSLQNGLRVVLAPTTRFPVVELRLLYPIGIDHDPPDKPGTVAVATSLARPDFDTLEPVDRYAAWRWSFLAGTVTPIATRRWSGWRIRAPADRVEASLFQLGLYAQRAEVSEKARVDLLRRLRAGEPPDAREQARLSAAVLRALYGARHPLSRQTALTADLVERLSVADLQPFAAGGRGLRGAVLIVAGQFDPDVIESAARDLFGAFSAGPAPPPSPPVARIEPAPLRAFAVRDDGSATLGVAYAFAMPVADAQTDAAMQVLAEALDERARRIREVLGASYGITVDYRQIAGTGTLEIAGDVDADRAADAIAEVMAVARMATTGAGLEDAFLRARRRIVERVRSAGASSARLAALLTAGAFDAGPRARAADV
ncbi:MAG: insulinase family protein, partial [Deltaproteobacteria bacterium]